MVGLDIDFAHDQGGERQLAGPMLRGCVGSCSSPTLAIPSPKTRGTEALGMLFLAYFALSTCPYMRELPLSHALDCLKCLNYDRHCS